MAKSGYVEFDMGDGTVLIVETGDDMGYVSRTSRGGPVNFDAGEESGRKVFDFQKAMNGAKVSIMALKNMFDESMPDEVEVTFGLKASGEAGNFVIAKASTEMNYQVTMKWKNPAASPATASD